MKRQAFTLTELLVVMMILGVMAGLALAGMAGAVNLAKEQRTRAIIAKIDQWVGSQYEDYRTRTVPINSNPNFTPAMMSRARLYALRELMRMELPDRVTDITDSAVAMTISAGGPSAWQSYRRMALRACGGNWPTTWTEQFQGSECLYLILSRIQDGDKAAIDYFLPGEIGDTDGDGMKEVLDGWGSPIEFLRWAPAFTIQNNALTDQTSAYTSSAINATLSARNCERPDYFDPAKADPRWTFPSNSTPVLACFALRPLIVSPGQDKVYDIATRVVDANGKTLRYSALPIPNDPYYQPANAPPLGTLFDFDGDGPGWQDNLTNHYQQTP